MAQERNARQRRYPRELRERAVRLVAETAAERGDRHGAVTHVAHQLGIGPESVRQWVRQAEIDCGDRGGLKPNQPGLNETQGGSGSRARLSARRDLRRRGVAEHPAIFAALGWDDSDHSPDDIGVALENQEFPSQSSSALWAPVWRYHQIDSVIRCRLL
jgi:transposase-like protein